jgi:hypothetical protein
MNKSYIIGVVAASFGAAALLPLTKPDVSVDFDGNFKLKGELNQLTDQDVSAELCGGLDTIVAAFNEDHMQEGKTLVIPQEIKAACPGIK